MKKLQEFLPTVFIVVVVSLIVLSVIAVYQTTVMANRTEMLAERIQSLIAEPGEESSLAFKKSSQIDYLLKYGLKDYVKHGLKNKPIDFKNSRWYKTSAEVQVLLEKAMRFDPPLYSLEYYIRFAMPLRVGQQQQPEFKRSCIYHAFAYPADIECPG